MASAVRERPVAAAMPDLVRLHSSTAHDWETEKRVKKNFFDDGTISFFWRAHTVTALFIFSCILFYVALLEEPMLDKDYNVKRGLMAMILAFLLFGVINTPDGAFVRPHPAFWRLILCLSIVYELALVFLLFQTADDARLLMKHFDKKLGVPLPEKSYGGNCLIYDPENADPWHNLWDKMDGFVLTHFFGWWLKTLIIRDWWLCTVISIMFEVMEYTLEHQLPNFSECWWDHWLADALICNGGGIYFGMITLDYLSMKPYHWRGMWNIPTYKGQLKRIAQQFTPYSWTQFEWKPTSSFKRWIAMLGIIAIFLLAELNTFYLKFVLWLPPEHYLCLWRLVFLLFMGASAMRETFQYLDDPKCKKFGRQSWLIAAIIFTEFMVSLKFDWATMTIPLPTHIATAWTIGLSLLLVYTVLKFYVFKDCKHDVPEDQKLKNKDVSDVHINNNTEEPVASGPTLRSRVPGKRKD